jgi:hypothetical protein
MAVTTPEEGYRIPPNFVIAGWAIDGDAPSGTGVDTVHIWALPHSGGPAMFLAALTPNQSRPEVGMLYGARFVNSGFFFNARMVPLGKYTLAIFARSTATGTFNQVKTINVSIE